MVNEGMDPCECIWGHELAMRRLLNLLRNSQAYCTETECFEEGSEFRQATNDNYLLMTMFLVVAMFLYYMRPRNSEGNRDRKPAPGNDFHGSPPSLPPAAI